LRIGYVSGDFGLHPVGHFLAPILAHHDTSAFEIVCYASRRLDDAMTARLRARADHWRDLVGLDDDEAAALIARDRIDLLIDLSGHTEHNRLGVFARRPAPLQASWLGFWGTTGLDAIDFILSDALTIPAAEEDGYSERVVRLPGLRFCYAPPDYAPPPLLSPRQGVVFGSFNNLAKLGPDAIRLWARLLQRVPEARLLLKWKSLGEAATRQRLVDGFAAEGIGAERLILRGASPHQAMLAEYNDIDVALDPFPFSGGLTSCEALWMGVPVVTLPRGGPASRQSAGFVTALGHPDWVARDEEDYLRIAADLAADRDRIRRLRGGLRPAMARSALCDGAAFTKTLEQVLRGLWHGRLKTSGLRRSENQC
jgi:predicted O-linked N-acetylglucosamine transferase (SPINDLY family)